MKNYLRIHIILSLILASFISIKFFSHNDFFPSDQDEAPYLIMAKTFAQTNSVKAISMISENVSPIFETDWYGIFYPIVYGAIMKLIGIRNISYITINFTFLLCSILILYKSKYFEKDEKKILILSLISCPIIYYFSFFFMPILLNVLFTIILLLFLKQISIQQDTYSHKKNILIYLLIVFFISLFKPTFAFWGVAIVAFSKNFKQLFLFGLISLFNIIVANVYMKFCTAPAFAQNISNMNLLFKFEFLDFFKFYFSSFILNTSKAVKHFNNLPYGLVFPYYFVLISPFYFFIRYFKSDNKFLFSLSIICLVNLFFVLLFYYVHYDFFIRMTAPVFIILCFIIALDKKLKVFIKASFLFLMLLNSFYIIKHSDKYIFKKSFEVEYAVKSNNYNCLQEINKNITKQLVTTILIDRDILTNNPTVVLMSLPYVTKENNIIRYTCNIRGEDKFQLFNKIKVDYVISQNRLSKNNLQLLFYNKTYYFYRYL